MHCSVVVVTFRGPEDIKKQQLSLQNSMEFHGNIQLNIYIAKNASCREIYRANRERSGDYVLTD